MHEPFRDPETPLLARIADLSSRLTLEEKVGLLHQYQAPVERLGLGPFRTGTEALHGLAWQGPATVFPQAIGLASTWDPDLVRQVGEATGEEVLVFHHKDPTGVGRNVWAPVVNPLRDPRWGRNEEGYSEDPWLTGLMATAYASGLRGSDPHVLRTAPTLKHFLAYNNETDRCATSSNVPPRVLHEYELPAFRPAIEQGAAVAVMPSYNLVNGRPAHLSPLINEVLRGWAPDDLLVVSDAYAPANLVEVQAYHDTPAEAYAHAVKAGLDSFTQDDDRAEATLGHLREALRRGLLTEDDLDTAVRHALSVRFRLGEFDPATPYDHVTEEVVNCPEHQDLARRAARQSFVLLANDGLLPLGEVARLAVIGQLGDTLMEDWYSGTLPYAVTARRGLAERCETVFCEGVDRVTLTADAGPVTADPAGGPLSLGSAAADMFDVFDWGGGAYALRAVATGRFVSVADGIVVNDQPGPSGWEVRQTFRLEERPRGSLALRHLHTGRYVGTGDDGTLRLVDDADQALRLVMDVVRNGAEQAAELAATADVAIVVVGDHPLVNGRETEDRSTLALAPAQDAVVKAVHAANPRTVMVVSSGYPLTWTSIGPPAVLWSAHGGQEYGHALAEVLFGDADPQGRLTQTWYRAAEELPDLLDYDIITADATYLYFRGTPRHPFGHGLSYTTFGYADLRVRLSGGELTAEVTVTNTGTREGAEVVQFYTHQRRSRVKQPLRRLRGFDRLRLAPGQSGTARLTLPVSELAFWDVTRSRFVVESAPHRLMVGRSAADLRLSAGFEVAGETIPPRAGLLRAVDHDEYDAVAFVDADRECGEAVRAEAEGAWILFRQVDLTGAASCRVVAGGADGGMITLRLGDPLHGRALVTFPVPRTGRYDLRALTARLAGEPGVHDLYVVFENEGVTLTQLDLGPGA
ncbi:glycoside hydrolase family 3 C-terminal domain-containing protein [Nonomuraea glycinis]|uniref:Exo-alpha-(1->6)-L-arabinopyranosidase n=1 Tax=Nonomuraea glycinis TaxID=2047744 RepID=A0A918AF22_9ACTN|nr:glycoside hydrolase family 3 protein [Nonomuraea glycinis]MCA2182908.1 glycoside hydrolase family 3 C-terminal domain-containing protein [Nonomuraea glycinis]GGP17433.1 beta-glucosidase [Nonomuraea glycinis]